ncbi:MAG: glucose 1-dehydrogenase [Hyphomicrobiales bacterium]|nr:glucose 1-dehydrogenase [Hyphomicrobiales bacterium]
MDKVILITGGSRGIGAAVARRAARDGYAVAVNYRARADAAQALVAEIEAGGGRAVAIQADVAREDDIVDLFDETRAHLGTPTALVNSAGVTLGRQPVPEFDAGMLHELFAVNVVGTLLCCREAVRRMSTRHGGRGGAIVNLSSLAASTGGRPYSSHYAASKGAIDAFTLGLSREAAPDGIRVNAVRPGMTRTDMTEFTTSDPERARAIAASIPLQRIAEADEVAAPILWLLSDEASFITGVCLDVAGGGYIVGPSAHPA